jgi:hypothetical protein
MLHETISRFAGSSAGASRGRRLSCVGGGRPGRARSSFELAERLVQVWIRSDGHLRTLRDLNEKLTAARRYLASANANRALGGAYLERLRDKRARCLALLNAERRTALSLMAESEARGVGGRRRACGA